MRELAAGAAGVALAEIVDLAEVDERPIDGPLYLKVRLKILRSSGKTLDELHVIKSHGGLAPDGANRQPHPYVLSPDALQVGQRYWLAFASDHIVDRNPFGLLGAWPEDDQRASQTLSAAIAADRYLWRPQYDPQTDLSYGYLIENRPPRWRIRVQKDGNTLWEKVLPGERTGRYSSWGLWPTAGLDLPANAPLSDRVLIAETATSLPDDNEYDLPPKKYYIRNAYDPPTGNRLASWVSAASVSQVDLVRRLYDPESGALRQEDRYDYLETGGLEAGAAEESWRRKTTRTYDSDGGIREEAMFRFDDTRADDPWVKIKS